MPERFALLVPGSSPHRPVKRWPIERLIPYADNPRLHSGADLDKTDLRAADLSGARGLTLVQIASARGDVHTKLPEGMVRPADWVDPP